VSLRVTDRDVRDALEAAQQENRTLRKELERARADGRRLQAEITRLAASLEAARVEQNRLAGLWLEQLNPERHRSTIDVARLMEFLKTSP
jgi:hypothetical protein